MGWMKRKNGMWGDYPQDVMDVILSRKLGKKWYDREILLWRARKAVKEIMADKKLRARIDRIYKQAWNRKATTSEYKGLIWGISSINKGKHL
ncbi:hypothetical protein LCGC14_0480770 [marine sediment metagenome]|uniref:Uncharacterized protein n=1 Tax=marine sediment metagenome TaxID=412755 RepID=A0A0F9VI21_9ZZZZ